MSFLPVKKNFEVYIGASFEYSFTWKEEENPVNLVPYIGVMPIVPANTEEVWLELTSYSGLPSKLVFGGETGVITIKISAAQTKNITWHKAAYELLLENPETEQTPALLIGKFSAVSELPPGVKVEV